MPTKYYVNSIDREFMALAHGKRKLNGITALGLSSRLSALGIPMHRVRIAKWENDNGGRAPTLGESIALAHALDIDINAFINKATLDHLQADLDAAYRNLLQGSSLSDGLAQYAAGESVSSDWIFTRMTASEAGEFYDKVARRLYPDDTELHRRIEEINTTE